MRSVGEKRRFVMRWRSERRLVAVARARRTDGPSMVATGGLPLEYMLRVMRDPDAEPSRQEAIAKAAASYHPQLRAVAHQHLNTDGNLNRPNAHAS